MNLLMLALLKKSIDDRNAAAARARNRKKRTEKGGKGKNSPYSGSSYNQNKYTEKQYFYKIVSDDPLLVAFFQAIEKKGAEIDVKDAEEIRKRVEVALKAQAERVEKIEEKKKELEKLGLGTEYTVSYNSNITVGEKVLDSGRRAFWEKGEYANVSKSFGLEHEGMVLVREWFKPENREVNPFDNRYEEWLRKHSDLDNQIAEKSYEVTRQERRVKYGLFDKDEKELVLNKLQTELEELEAKRAHGEEIKRERYEFAKITPEQKEKIHEYYELVAECAEKGREIDQDIKAYIDVKGTERGYYGSYNRQQSAKGRNKWERAIEELIAEGELSEELLDAVDTIVSEENIGYERYSEGLDEYELRYKGLSDDFKDAVGWFIETRREKIALKALHRKEAAYKALEVEHKKLCDAAGLVDRAEELEGKGLPEEGDEEYGE